MSEARKRSPNWLQSEKELLLSLVEIHYSIIENKKTDGVTIKAKLAQWQIIADQYNSQTTNCSRTGETLKSQWESMKKMARKDAANNRKHIIKTGGGSSMPPKRDDPFLQRILSLISTSAVGLFNPYDGDCLVPPVQDQGVIPAVQIEVDDPEPPPIQYIDISVPSTVLIEGDQIDELSETQEFVRKDWGDYTPQLLRTPVSLALQTDPDKKVEKQIPTHRPWVSRRRPAHSNTSLEQLHKKKMEAIELQKKLAVDEMERAKVLHELDVQIKKQILKQEKIKTNMLLCRQRNLFAKKRKMP